MSGACLEQIWRTQAEFCPQEPPCLSSSRVARVQGADCAGAHETVGLRGGHMVRKQAVAVGHAHWRTRGELLHALLRTFLGTGEGGRVVARLQCLN
jgi:hypothetical protein